MKTIISYPLTSIQIIGAIMLSKNMRAPQYANHIGCAKSTLYDVAAGDLETTYVREAISRDIGIPIADIWGTKDEPTTH